MKLREIEAIKIEPTQPWRHTPPPGAKVLDSGYSRQWREAKACEGCGYIRKVLVREWRPSPGAHASAEGLWFKRHCQACELESRARQYAETARRFARKAQAIREKRHR
jgi:hypothetical protein